MDATPPTPPRINIPTGSSTVSVSIIDTTGSVGGLTTGSYLSPVIQGHDYLAVPCLSFLIRHELSGRLLLFDLGIRSDWENLSPSNLDGIKEEGFEIRVTKNVRRILQEGGVDPDAVEAIIWSHYHFDHTGDPSEFPPSTSIIVGPGFCEAMLPGYPTNPEGTILESDYAGRELREINFTDNGTLSIGRFRALDYFADGSLYLLDAPGHTIGHICGLARVTTNPDSFIWMGADSANHGAEIRPSKYLPLPEELSPNPLQPCSPAPCPGHVFEPPLRDRDPTIPFYVAVAGSHEDTDEMVRTVAKVQDLDAHDNVLVVLAHDESLFGVIDFFPATADDFMENAWLQKSRWRFLKDFEGAVGVKTTIDG